MKSGRNNADLVARLAAAFASAGTRTAAPVYRTSFRLARAAHAVCASMGINTATPPEAALREALRQACASSNGHTDDLLLMVVMSWSKVKSPDPVVLACEAMGDVETVPLPDGLPESAKRVATFAYYLQRGAGGASFPLPCRRTATALGLSPTIVSASIRLLCERGLLAQTRKHVFDPARKKRLAAEFRYLGSPVPHAYTEHTEHTDLQTHRDPDSQIRRFSDLQISRPPSKYTKRPPTNRGPDGEIERDTIIAKSKPRRDPCSEPVSVGDVLTAEGGPAALHGSPPSNLDLVEACADLETNEPVAEARAFWLRRVEELRNVAGGLLFLSDCLKRIEDSKHRERGKDVGELRNPAGWLNKMTRTFLNEHSSGAKRAAS